MARQKASAAEPSHFVTWNEGDKVGRALALREAGRAVERAQPVRRASANEFFQVAPHNTSIRNTLSRRDYEDARPGAALPDTPQAAIAACQRAYKRVGVVRNVVDLMSDFACRGVDLAHPNERVEQWYREWFRQVRGSDRSERFLNRLYRQGNVVVARRTTTLTPKPDASLPSRPPVEGIPWRYTFYNPLSLEVLSPGLAVFAGVDQFRFAVKLPRQLANVIKSPKTEWEKELVSQLPAGARGAKGDLLPLDPKTVKAFYYKKDDDEVWASPMLEAVLPDVQLLQKMKLADLAALDGAAA
jgi:hypothetical protein